MIHSLVTFEVPVLSFAKINEALLCEKAYSEFPDSAQVHSCPTVKRLDESHVSQSPQRQK